MLFVSDLETRGSFVLVGVCLGVHVSVYTAGEVSVSMDLLVSLFEVSGAVLFSVF